MNKKDIKVYIAAPFFNEEEVRVVEEIEFALNQYQIEYFSPRSEGVIKNMTPEERKERMRNIYDSNMDGIAECNLMIAVIDGRDVGTMFELGVQACLKRGRVDERYIVTFSDKNFGLNVMLKFASDCHINGFEEFQDMLYNIGNEGLTHATLEQHDTNFEVIT